MAMTAGGAGAGAGPGAGGAGGAGTVSTTSSSTVVKESVVDDVARLSAGVLKPRPALTDGSVKSLWLAELGAAVAARVRDCLHCGSGSAVRALLTQTDTELDIHVRVLRVKAVAGPVGVADLRGWMILQQTVREKIAADGALADLPAPCFESTERPAAQAIEFCQCSPEELPKQLERAGVTTVEDGRRTVCFVVVVGPPTEPIRTHMEAAKSSSFVVSMVPPADNDDESDSAEQGDGEDDGNSKGAAGGATPGLHKLEQLRLHLKQNSRTKSGEPWVSLGYDDSVFDPRSSEPARLQLWPRTKEDASAVALAATMTFRLCPSTPGGVICDAWHVHAAPELTSKRVKAPGAGATIQAHEFLRGQAGRRWLHLRDGSGWVLEGLRSAAGKPRGGGWRQIE